jgi:hypothetical protein
MVKGYARRDIVLALRDALMDLHPTQRAAITIDIDPASS